MKIDGKTRTDPKFPTGFMDVIQIDKTGENFRLIYDGKGRFTVHRITAQEAKYKLMKQLQESRKKSDQEQLTKLMVDDGSELCVRRSRSGDLPPCLSPLACTDPEVARSRRASAAPSASTRRAWCRRRSTCSPSTHCCRRPSRVFR